jgi:hypothetical protein
MKKEYFAPEIDVMLIEADIITYSETEEWEGPVIKAGMNDSKA